MGSSAWCNPWEEADDLMRQPKLDPRYSHGPVKVIYSRDDLTPIQQFGPKARYADHLRTNAPKSEQLFLLHLQQRRPDLRFWHQHVIEGYIVDFVLPKYNLILEIDGPHHKQRREYDRHRTRVLEKKGFKVLRLYASYCYNETGRDKLLQLVEKTCQALSSVCNQPLESEPAG